MQHQYARPAIAVINKTVLTSAAGNTTIIYDLDHRRLFMIVADIVYDASEHGEEIEDTTTHVLDPLFAFASPDRMRVELRDGATMMILPEIMEDLDILGHDVVVRIHKDNKLWGTFGKEDFNY